MACSTAAQTAGTNLQAKDTSKQQRVSLVKDSIRQKFDSIPNRLRAVTSTARGEVSRSKQGVRNLADSTIKSSHAGRGLLIGKERELQQSADTILHSASALPRTLFVQRQKSLHNRWQSFWKSVTEPFSQQKHDRNIVGRAFDDSSLSKKLYRPLLRFGGGYVNYDYDYRSSIDTPFAEKNIGQHSISGGLTTVIANALPVNINFWIRRSNSILYRDITDVQVSFDANQYKSLLLQRLYARLLNSPSLKDSLLEKLLAAKLAEFTSVKDFTTKPATIQQLHESHEIVAQDDLQKRGSAADSAVNGLSKQKVETARLFLELFEKTQKRADSLGSIVDSLQHLVTLQRTKMAQLRRVATNPAGNAITDYSANQRLDNDLTDSLLPAKYQWLVGIRNASVGRTPVNYSELTAKNISITGINVEYNSWYYLAFAAGAIDYRFRDAVVNRTARTPQYMYLLRAGLGKLEKNYFIVSYFNGRKQLYNNPADTKSLSVAGITAETKWQLTSRTYLIAEAGQSAAPDVRSTPPERSNKFSWNGNNNKAYSVKLYTAFPAIAARAEGAYKFTGANYQSFNAYQNSAAATTWYVKWEQQFFKRKLRITGNLRSNEFTNPYIVQSYKANTIFKSINVSFRMRKLPVISAGYMPMSQLSVVGQQVVENRFQTLTASIYHHYKIGNRQAFSMLAYNKFYNTHADSSFINFNAQNIFFTQTIIYRLFTAGIAITDSRNSQYHLVSAELNLRVPLLPQTSATMAVKLNDLNQQEIKTGGRLSLESAIGRHNRISIAFEKAYLPGLGKNLTSNDMGTVQYSRYF